jgi:hypothetical protein
MYSGEYDVCDVTKVVGSIPAKVVGSIPTVARHIFQACPMWIYTQSTEHHKHQITVFISKVVKNAMSGNLFGNNFGKRNIN